MYFSLGVKERREDFYDMERELEMLVHELEDPLTRMIVIKGIRRVGKSSLLKVALSETKMPYLLMDLRAGGPLTPEEFYSYFADALSELLERNKRIERLLSRIKGIEIAGFKVELTEKRLFVVRKVLDELDKWARDEKFRVIIALDEAQRLRFIRGFDKLLAHIYDYHNGLKLVLAGSEVGLLDKLLGKKDSETPLFGRAYAEIVIDRLSEEKARDFLSKGFRQVGLKVPDDEISDVISKIDGIIGWLTYYGYYRMRMSHSQAIERTLDEGARLAAGEFENFLSMRQIARRRYIEVLKILVRPSRWVDVKRGLRIALGMSISDKQISNYLSELVDYGFVAKVDGRYVVADQLLAEAILRGYIR